MASNGGRLAITYVGHATVLVEMGGARILTDPLLRSSFGPIRRVCPVPRPEQIGRVDGVVVSHLHHDHFDPRSLASLGNDLPVVVPSGAGVFAERAGLRGVVELGRGATLNIAGVRIEAVPAVHDGRRFPRGPRADAVGYRLAAEDRVVYFAGDTAIFGGMAALGPGVDAALLPVWGWGPHLRGGHLTPRRAADAVRLIRPAFAIPIHWGTYWPTGLGWYRRGRLTAPAAEFQHHVEALGLPSTVVVLEPGHRWDLENDD
ncbi:MAG: MBL fold metallo-hydrolase [Dehalococcoidia bacterium]